MANYNNMAIEVVGSAMEIDRLSELPDELLLSMQGFGTQPLIFNPWKMANYNNMATTEVVGSDRLSALPDELLLSIPADLKKAAKTATLSKPRWSRKLVDQLSALPDDLLVDILCRLDDTKEAARSAALSKRWRFLWTKLPVFSFSIPIHIREIARPFGWVREALAARNKAATLDLKKCSFRLYLSLYYVDIFANDLIALLDFASESMVSGVYLNLTAGYKILNNRPLPQALYSYPSLRMLSLEHLKLAPPTTSLEWGLMTEVSLLRVELPQRAFDQIVSGCPLLRRLGARYCWGFNRLDVGGRHFRELDVAYCSGLLEISAPYMTSLNVKINPLYTTLRLTDVSSLEQLSICSSNSICCCNNTLCAALSLRIGTRGLWITSNLFQLLQHVTTLVLYKFLEVLSNRMDKGGQLPQFRVRHLTIKDDIDRDNITLVLAILESSPFLDKLVIHDACWRSHKSYCDPDPDPGVDLICDLLHLKTIEIIVDIGRQLPRTLPFILAQILLRRAPVLEEMVIRVEEKISKSVDYSELFSELVKKFNTLLTYPKSSPKALVYISL